MAIRDYRNLDEIMDTIEESENEAQRLKEKLKEKREGRFKRLIHVIRKENNQYKLYRKKLEGKIKEKTDTIDELEDIIDEAATFDFDTATDFIANAISIIEQEHYQRIDFELENTKVVYNPALSIALDMPMVTPKTDYENVCLITTPKNRKQICRMYDANEINSSYDIEMALDDGKYILLEDSDIYTMFDYRTWEVPEKLTRNYHYLEEIIPGLIDLKLERTHLSDKQVTALMLKKIPQSYPHLIKSRK